MAAVNFTATRLLERSEADRLQPGNVTRMTNAPAADMANPAATEYAPASDVG